MSDTTETSGLGCKTLLTAVGMLLGFAVVAVALGLFLILGEDPSPAAETVGLTLYPVSGIFAAIAGDLPLALPLDALVWIVAGAGVTKLSERTGGLTKPVAGVVAVALLVGLVVSTLVELA